MSAIMSSLSKGRGYGQQYPSSIYQRNPGVSLAKGAFSYNYNQHNNGNSSVHKEYRNINQVGSYGFSNQYKDSSSSKQQLSTYERELEDRKEKEKAQNAYRIR
jgi:hypothetical protein